MAAAVQEERSGGGDGLTAVPGPLCLEKTTADQASNLISIIGRRKAHARESAGLARRDRNGAGRLLCLLTITSMPCTLAHYLTVSEGRPSRPAEHMLA